MEVERDGRNRQGVKHGDWDAWMRALQVRRWRRLLLPFLAQHSKAPSSVANATDPLVISDTREEAYKTIHDYVQPRAEASRASAREPNLYPSRSKDTGT